MLLLVVGVVETAAMAAAGVDLLLLVVAVVGAICGMEASCVISGIVEDESW